MALTRQLRLPNFEARRVANEVRLRKQAHDRILTEYASDNYIKWLILGEEYKKAEEILLSSFDIEEKKKNLRILEYTDYYCYHTIWKWVDKFPADYQVEPLVQKLIEIVTFPKQYIVSQYAHRSLQISLFILSEIMDSGRFADAFFATIGGSSLASYFTSRASDDGETRDGWDKFYMTCFAAICLKKLDKVGVAVPDEIRESCEKMKLTYNFMSGDPNEGMFYGGGTGFSRYGILSDPRLFKDICTLKSSEGTIGGVSVESLQKNYNTLSLCFYLANSDEEDMSFIEGCINNHADLTEACNQAIESIQSGKVDPNRGKLTNIPRRLEFIRSLLENNSDTK